jgi:hypothetical protein
MKVLIIGSLPKDKQPEIEKERYRQACRDIGKNLADNDWPFGIGTFNADTADSLMIEGAAKSDHNVNVTVYLRDEEYDLFAEEKQRRESQAQGLKLEFDYVEGTWQTGRIEQILKSDIVFLIGGGDKTAPAFIVANLLKRPCLPIPGFGGASEVQWKKFSVRAETLGLDPQKELRQQTRPWRGDDSASAVLKFAERYVDSNPYPEKDKFFGVLLVVAACSALIWTILFFGQSPARGWSLLGILVTASVMGTSLYWLLPRSRERNDTPVTAKPFFIRVMAAIIESITLFLLLLASTGFINGSSSIFDSLSDRGIFARFAIIAGIFGFASGIMTEAIYQSLQTRLMKPISTSDDESTDHKP